MVGVCQQRQPYAADASGDVDRSGGDLVGRVTGLDGDARVRRLIAKQRGFTEEDKRELRAIELEIVRRVIPEYRDATARGQIELSTSPFYLSAHAPNRRHPAAGLSTPRRCPGAARARAAVSRAALRTRAGWCLAI